MSAVRLDVALVQRGLARSRTAASAAIADGRVLVGGRPATRSSVRVAAADAVLVAPGSDRVGRGAVKLEAALDRFAVDPAGRLALDLGASTGGFTQVLLQRGARRVVALDVGHGQLAAELRTDARVVVVEGENARWLDRERVATLTASGDLPGLVVADLSFISLAVVLPAIARVAGPEADVIVLIKPQFEVGRTRIRRGVVADAADRVLAVGAVLRAAAAAGLGAVDLMPSPIVGAHGNREVLAHLHPSRGRAPAEWEPSIGTAVGGPDGEAG